MRSGEHLGDAKMSKRATRSVEFNFFTTYGNGFRSMKEEKQIYKICCLRFFNFCLGTKLWSFKSLVMILQQFFWLWKAITTCTVRSGAEERTFSGFRLDVLIFRLRSSHVLNIYLVTRYIADVKRPKSHKNITFLVQAVTFLYFQAGRSSASRSSASDLTVSPQVKIKNLRQIFVTMNMMSKCAKFHKDGKKLNSISRARLNFRRRTILCTTLYRNLM